MKCIRLPDDSVRRLSFYLSLEEYVARTMAEDELLCLWQVEPSVIFGRNQVIEREVNLPYCRDHGIQVYQRRSGGGCVYADRDNLMVSYICRQQQVSLAFNRFITMMVLMLHQLGVQAVATRHNDILVDGRKVCGTACQKLGSCCIVHGTLLYDTNMDHMTQAITPAPAKLQKNGVESVRQRIGLLKDSLPMGLPRIRQHLHDALCQGDYLLSSADVQTISQQARRYEVPI